jgi:HSP20 family protein
MSKSSHFHRLIARGEITTEEMVSQQYVRFSPADAWRPHLNIYESPSALIVCVDISGMKPDAFEVDVVDGALIIRGRRTAPTPESHGGDIGVHLMEIDNGPFCRQVGLPTSIDRDAITAEYRDGLLWITLPKSK